MIETVTSPHPQDRLAQRSCPSCFGRSHPDLLPKKNNCDIFICLDGNFQHRHHERSEKGHLSLQTPVLFIPPDEVEDAKEEIRQHELALRKSDKAKDRCSEIHKAADDKRNGTTWKGCDDTGIMGCCCRHDAVVYYCNINQSGEGRGLPFSIIKHLFTELDSSRKLRILYDIGCSLDKFIKLRKLLPHLSERMKKTIKAYAHKRTALKVLNDLTILPNPHSFPIKNYTHDFFQCQWQKQCSFESNQKQADIEKKQEIAQHLERKEQLRLLAESFNSMVGTSKQGNEDALAILDNIHQLQKDHDKQLIKAGGYFNDLNAHDKDCEEHLALLWSAKSQLFKKAVEIQSELQPLKNSKNRGDWLGTRLNEKIFAALNQRKAAVVKVIKTFCDQRCKYLSKFALELVNLPENQPFDYSSFLAMTLDDPIWNDGFLCTSKEPWAVEPIVRNGIHAVLAFDRTNEEIDWITIDLQHALSWGVYHHKQLTQAKDKCSHKGSEGLLFCLTMILPINRFSELIY
ncbi:hypothetical protein PCANC_14882 [Puccinia coronata f. sp. avenae]|uniref:CxC1-like cysteine cluster associated with KDZ transposases domain-containing protein n=1 Tax=Puccinia coronata f. sp. avenae TaxID=200324 RepID=A0A2N5UNS7_9BASI|nr:hypothetical protein PCANC_14882 [Puccinia coronata f. sp. avenae]